MCAESDGDPASPGHAAERSETANPAVIPRGGARPYVLLQDRLKSADEVKQEWDNLLVYRNIAIGAAGGVLVLGNVINAYYEGLAKASFNYYLFGELLVRIGLIVLTLLWIHSGTVEHGYIMRWIRTPTLRSRRPVQVMLSFFVLAAFFAILMIVAGRVHRLLLLYCIFLLVDIATVKLRRDEIGAAIDSGEKFLRAAVPQENDAENTERIARDRAIAELYRRALQVLRGYYFNRRHLTRIVATLAGMALLCFAAYVVPLGAFGLVPVDASAGKLSLMGLDIPFDVARFIAYLLFLLVLFSSEVVVARWRSAMRDELYDVRDEMVGMLG